ncbi:LytR/AlgR family response regulator transcription factor [Solimonas flava]|uniref:LytR/AlgR family response regulator transcription factor n=1 Tax=Solimonas flava TaxID=415849 RepID=UPI00040001E3|nr:LytTR family DNA-binding domain-containing protein [Solimonas flava]
MSAPLQVAIVDDEPLARARLRRLLQKIDGERIRIALECVDAEELLHEAGRVPLDALFLDIEMPGGGGFGALQRWPGTPPVVVFVTAYSEHAVRAFDARALDYLVKPVAEDRLRDTVARLRALDGRSPPAADAPHARIALPLGPSTHLVALDDIDLIVARGNYLDIHAIDRTYVVRRTLREFLAGLDPARFVQLHRSAVVRVGAIRAIRPQGSGRFRLELRGERRVHTGRNFRARVQALLVTPVAGSAGETD